MSFREKSDWFSFVSLCLLGIYFAEVARGLLGGAHPGGNYYFVLFSGLVLLLVAIQVVTHVVLAIRSPAEARTPLDERERQIQLRATPPAYYLLLIGTFLTIGTMHMGFSVWQMAHCVLFCIWIAELLRFGLRLYFYRRGA